MMLVLIAALGAIFYASFLFNPQNKGDTLPFIFVMIAESFLIAQALLSMWTILASSSDPRPFRFYQNQGTLFSDKTHVTLEEVKSSTAILPSKRPIHIDGKRVSIDVFITTYGEDLKVIEATAKAARDMVGEHTTYILDDGRSNEVRLLADRLGIHYETRLHNVDAKAGNINHALHKTHGRFFVIFDADFVADELFLYETMAFFEDKKVAFVQTPQYYNNMNNILSRGAGYMQHVFYSLIQPGKNRFNAAFCVGTNVIFRRSAIMKIGGMYSKSKSEDIWTSILLHERGFKSVYIPNVLAIGKTPETIKMYSKQQLRWATGGFEIFFRHNPLLRKNLSVDQKIQYLGTSTYYFSGIATLLLLLLPPLQIFFNLTPVDLRISAPEWVLYYSSFYILQILLAFYTMRGFRIESLIVAGAVFPVYVKAFFNALFKRDQAWQATGAKDGIDSAYNYIIPQLLIFLFLVLTTIVGAWKSIYTSEISVSLFWNIVNTCVFGSFYLIARSEARQLKKGKKRNSKQSIKRIEVVTQ